MLLQIFTKPLGDRPTVFFEIIQRLCALPLPLEAAAAGAAEVGEDLVPANLCDMCGMWQHSRVTLVLWVDHSSSLAVRGCLQAPSESAAAAAASSQRAQVPAEVGGCGGFGKGNFRWVLRPGAGLGNKAQHMQAGVKCYLAPGSTPGSEKWHVPLCADSAHMAPHPPRSPAFLLLQRAVQEHRGVRDRFGHQLTARSHKHCVEAEQTFCRGSEPASGIYQLITAAARGLRGKSHVSSANLRGTAGAPVFPCTFSRHVPNCLMSPPMPAMRCDRPPVAPGTPA